MSPHLIPSLLALLLTIPNPTTALEAGTGYTTCSDVHAGSPGEGYICMNNYADLAYCVDNVPTLLKSCACGAGCCGSTPPGDFDEPGSDGQCLCGEDNGDGSVPVKCTNGNGGNGGGGGGGGNNGGHAMGNVGDFTGGGIGVGPVVVGSLGQNQVSGERRCREGLVDGLIDAVLGLLGGAGRRCGGES